MDSRRMEKVLWSPLAVSNATPAEVEEARALWQGILQTSAKEDLRFEEKVVTLLSQHATIPVRGWHLQTEEQQPLSSEQWRWRLVELHPSVKFVLRQERTTGSGLTVVNPLLPKELEKAGKFTTSPAGDLLHRGKTVMFYYVPDSIMDGAGHHRWWTD